MQTPLQFLKPAMEQLSANCKILPAVGGAVEELLRPDQEEIDDALINYEANRITSFAETPEPSPQNLYRPTPPLSRREKPFFRFFVDGSLRTYFLGTVIEGERSFPLLIAQIGAVLIERGKDGYLSCRDSRYKVLLMVPKGGKGLSDSVWQKLYEVISKSELLELVDTTEKDIISGEAKEGVDLRNKAGGKARHRMHELEIELVESTTAIRDENNWLILDGAVKLGDFIKEPYLVGVAKSFRKDPEFYFGKKKERKDITSILAGLPHEHRTVAFSSYDGQVAFWYVRLREQKHVDYPLMGVVKVEIPCPDRQPISSELADLISRVLVGERSVAPYGCDRRWHALLYPVYMAEQSIKSKFYSSEVLLGAIRLPIPSNLYI